ncbi:hypothetical protein C8J27_103191 [Rhodobacter aestuarii]|uniref:Uncharacterized protein n=1 Tax=Rhodobacter aestuarii TaxID=453582 RepID=A0A1N7K4H5_9RHOB|nr:hypothetical protein [Rhodobacter aestuarii]PTV95862.1 hypothetical protein C8J27_103191 [Rhodobacter aestuarii]SIS56458.1 hypothetical protein SAMN05421580_102243 [Rhodobacter aestuarii]
MEDKVRENKLRRKAERIGLRIEKSRVRDEMAPDYGKFWILSDYNRSNLLDGYDQNGKHCLTIDDLEDRLNDAEYVRKITARAH